ncbi:tRNA uridine-5-carboxymethylaminomethyl(34) synthesis GTPase MnmE [Limoniibacter endophyticus]|uniref:tRNA modification GTPase MnmE n=1 Tax=Limoniibacter endophyticus TaxID=1565040 RepID=A0A8J3DT99_9HYPH|nr:tRNA uridine-5-carboxymethylaminomethyl(34) synthesis GTPase MnmE [Limoniibacter endophyticus]GHC74377.1 tRNA modification GTPase MnmE [Limoniibacter endophyticus]
MDTIFALSSGSLPSGVAVIRLTGKDCSSIIQQLFSRPVGERMLVYGRFTDLKGNTLDHGLCCFFPGPRSFTGEDSAEFHLHGSKAVIAAALKVLGAIPGTRMAEPGEFSKRAFLNGKMDLTGAEALKDLIDAETEAQRVQAVINTSGAQKIIYSQWRQRMLHARAMIEAELDFSDEGDVPGSVSSNVREDMERLLKEIEGHVAQAHRSEIVRDGFKIVLVGEPNVGKSSLLNTLCQREVAIVSEEAGTTRDVIQVSMDIDGIKCVISDTAGIREDAGHVEALGIIRAKEQIALADLVLLLSDSENFELASAIEAKDCIRISTKIDLRGVEGLGDTSISIKTGENLDHLLTMIGERARNAVGNFSDVVPSRQRHVDYLLLGAAHLTRFSKETSLEIQAEELRHASNALGRITGAIDVEDLLGHIFSSFCIGK